jgi:DNA-binding protein H-NS
MFKNIGGNMSLADLLKQKAELERVIAQQQAEERGNALTQVRELMSTYGLSVSDLAPQRAPTRRTASKGLKVAAKYVNKDTGEYWTGRGLQPKWLRAKLAEGAKLADFAT